MDNKSLSSSQAIKKLDLIRQKLELKRDDIAVSHSTLVDESRELKSRQEQLVAVRERCDKYVAEITQRSASSRAETARREVLSNEAAAMKKVFEHTLSRAVQELKDAKAQQIRKLLKQADKESELREVSVLYEDEEAVFRVTDESYTFDYLLTDACRIFELHPDDVQIVNERDEVWRGNASVRDELSGFENQYGHVLLKVREDETKDEEDLDDPDALLQLLLGEQEQLKEEEEEEEEEPVQQVGAPVKTAKIKKINKKQLYRELPVFVVFMGLFIVSTFQRRAGGEREGYFQVSAIRELLVNAKYGNYNEKSYKDISSFSDIFTWIEKVVIEGIYPGSKYNGDPFSPREVGAVMTYNRVVGGIRFRTVRARPNVGCIQPSLQKRKLTNGTHIFDQNFIDECWTDPNPQNEDTRPFSIGAELLNVHGSCDMIPAPPPPPDRYLDNYGGEPPTTAALNAMDIRKLCRAFTYRSAEETKESPFLSTNFPGVSYSAGGYVRDTDNLLDCRQRPADDPNPNPNGVCERSTAARDDVLLALQQLKNNLWLDQSSRAMFMKMTFYNGNLNVFMCITFAFEFSLGGRVFPSTSISTLSQELYKMDTPEKLTTTTLQLIVSAFVLYYISVQVSLVYASVKKTGWIGEWMSDVWNLLESIVLLGFFLSTFYQVLLLNSLYPPEAIFENEYTDFASIGALYKLSFALDSLCVIALFFKFLKYAQLNDSTAMLWLVLTRAAADMGYFIIFLLILMIAFAMMAMQLFGSQMREYATFDQAVISLLLVMLGSFDVPGMRMRQPGISPGLMFFFLYIIVMVLIMMNIFLAILGEAYTQIRIVMNEKSAHAVPTRRRTLMQYCQIVRAIIRARLNQRRKRQAQQSVGKGRAALEGKAGGKSSGKSKAAMSTIELQNVAAEAASGAAAHPASHDASPPRPATAKLGGERKHVTIVEPARGPS